MSLVSCWFHGSFQFLYGAAITVPASSGPPITDAATTTATTTINTITATL